MDIENSILSFQTAQLNEKCHTNMAALVVEKHCFALMSSLKKMQIRYSQAFIRMVDSSENTSQQLFTEWRAIDKTSQLHVTDIRI